MPANRIKLDPALERRYARQEQRRKSRQIVCKILIVSEGTKTEPNYFKNFDSREMGKYIVNVEVKGEADNTINVVNTAIELSKKEEYDSVWAVFDKDSFSDDRFNAAIIKAEKNGIGCAWSNEAFELWFLYHFVNRVTPMSRKEYADAISDAVNKSSNYKEKKKFKYDKPDKNLYKIMTTCGSVDNAILYAEAQSKKYTDKRYSTHNPCTMVYKLVRLLIGQDAGFNKYMIQKLEGDLTTPLPYTT
ncbi:MAG: RloB domain-containing protein [Bacteroidales bacterium]|nr:RloB domain-containing protein [Bacteroidales bacterium]